MIIKQEVHRSANGTKRAKFKIQAVNLPDKDKPARVN